MITDFFKAAAIMSGASSIVAVMLFVMGYVLRNPSYVRIRYRAWILVLILAVLPFSFIFNTASSGYAVETGYVSESEIIEIQSHDNIKISDEFSDIDFFDKISFVGILAFLWAAVVMIRLFTLVINYFRFLNKTMKNSEFLCKEGNVSVYEADIFHSPIAVGVIKKRIILPCEITDEAKKYVILHECMHFRHHDIAYKWIAAFVSSVHWFNPVFRFVSAAIEEDGEIYCDMSVCRNMDDDGKKSYMNVILDLISADSGCPVYTAMTGAGRNIVKRFSAIKSIDKKMNILKTALVLIAVIAVSACGVFVSGAAGGMVYGDDVFAITFNMTDNETAETKPLSAYKTAEKDSIKSEKHAQGADSSNVDSVFTGRAADDNYNKPAIDAEKVFSGKNSDYTYLKKENSPSVSAVEKNIRQTQPTAENPSRSEETAVDEKNDNTFSKKREEERIKNELEDDDYPYPYSGSIKYDGLTLNAITNDIEQNGGQKLSSDDVDLKNGYVSDTLTYLDGGISEIKNVTADSRGQVSFYMNSEYDQHIEISFEQDGKQIAGYGIIPDNETTYVFGGFNPEETYDITIASSTGGTWKVENEYIIY